MTDKKTVWTAITSALTHINVAVDILQSLDLNEDEQAQQLEIIRAFCQVIRAAAHDYIQPDIMTRADLIKRIQDALGTAETGLDLVEVARNAHKAEQAVAEIERNNKAESP